MTGILILLRHGESEWNAKNLFTGWVDVGLSAKGEAEAIRGGELLVESNLLPSVVHTSVLRSMPLIGSGSRPSVPGG